MSTGTIARDSLAETGSKGSFVRKDSVFRNFVDHDHPIYQVCSTFSFFFIHYTYRRLSTALCTALILRRPL
jgi:hypothetical protein